MRGRSQCGEARPGGLLHAMVQVQAGKRSVASRNDGRPHGCGGRPQQQTRHPKRCKLAGCWQARAASRPSCRPAPPPPEHEAQEGISGDCACRQALAMLPPPSHSGLPQAAAAPALRITSHDIRTNRAAASESRCVCRRPAPGVPRPPGSEPALLTAARQLPASHTHATSIWS